MHRFRGEKAACGTFQSKVCHRMTETETILVREARDTLSKISLWFKEFGLYPTEIFERF